jgi:hypothetical protein
VPCTRLRALHPDELVDFAEHLGDGGVWHHQLPPAGLELDYGATALPGDPDVSPLIMLPKVCGRRDVITPGDKWWKTLGALAIGSGEDVVSVVARWAANYAPEVNAAFAVADLPVIYEEPEGQTMRWLKSTIRGTLGSVEQFQFGLMWGNPGDDPTLDAAGCAAFAASLASKWDAVLATTTFGTGGAAFKSLFPVDVKFTEVGVCNNTQSESTSSDGTGGNLAQDDPTEWAPINGVTGRVGTGTGNSLPYEVAEAVTLHTNKRGPSGRGRIYLPPFDTVALVAGGLYDAGHAAAGGKAIGAFAEAVKADEGYDLLVVSRRRLVLNTVVQISTGIVPDSQRRRRWAQLEAPIVAWNQP